MMAAVFNDISTTAVHLDSTQLVSIATDMNRLSVLVNTVH